MALLAAGHDAALNDLMARHGERLFHYLTRQLGSESEAQDCSQETFVRVYLNRSKFRPQARFSTWLYTIATNLVRDTWRRRGRHPETSLDAERDSGSLFDNIPEAGPCADEKMMDAERADEVRRAVQALPVDLRTALVLFEYEEMSQAEIAHVLKCTPKAVEVRIYRARQALKKMLELEPASHC